jgi:cobalamin biosynthesis Co2+ chelatase CbiK
MEIIVYADDILIAGEDFEKVIETVTTIINLFTELDILPWPRCV